MSVNTSHITRNAFAEQGDDARPHRADVYLPLRLDRSQGVSLYEPVVTVSVSWRSAILLMIGAVLGAAAAAWTVRLAEAAPLASVACCV